MAFFLSPVGNSQNVTANGDPNTGGKILTYLAGTTTPAATYTSITGAVPQANPIILNSIGLPNSPIWLNGGIALKFVVQDAANVTLYTLDNITGINDATTTPTEWASSGLVPTFLTATTFSVPGDQTVVLEVGRRLRTNNTAGVIYSSITASVFAASITTVTTLNDAGALDSGLSVVAYGLLSSVNRSLPITPSTTARNNISASDNPYRNRVINGNLFEDQVNNGSAYAIGAGLPYAPLVDMFFAYCTGAIVSAQQVTAADGTKRQRFTGVAAVTAIGFLHSIEAANSVDLAGQTCTFSVKLRNTILTTVNWQAYYANTADTFGTLASPTRTLIASGTFTVNNTESVYSTQIAVPAAATTGIEIVVSVGAQTSGTWEIGEFQFEKGAIAPAAISFERVDVGLNKARCQRRVAKTYSSGTNPGTAVNDGALGTTSGAALGGAAEATWAYPVEMAGIPAITTYNPATGAVGSWRNVNDNVDVAASAGSIGTRQVSISISGTPTAQRIHRIHILATSRLH